MSTGHDREPSSVTTFWTIVGALRGSLLASPFLYGAWYGFSNAHSLATTRTFADGAPYAVGHSGITESTYDIESSIHAFEMLGYVTGAFALVIITAMALVHRYDP